MRKNIILLIITVFSVIFLFSCKKQTVQVTENNYEIRQFLNPDTTLGAINISIETEIPTYFKSDIVLDSIRKTIIKTLYGDNYISVATDSLAKKYADELVNEYISNNEPLIKEIKNKVDFRFDNEFALQGFSLLSDKKLFSYGISRYIYMGGIHSLNTRTFFNFDLKTGKVLTEADIFKDSTDAELSELIKLRIIEQSKEDSTLEVITNLEDTEYWVDAIKPNGNFYITENSINYVFNPYEIAPFALGETEVVLPYDRVVNLLKPVTILNHLLPKSSDSEK